MAARLGRSRGGCTAHSVAGSRGTAGPSAPREKAPAHGDLDDGEEAGSVATFDAVVKILVTSMSPDWSMPWQARNKFHLITAVGSEHNPICCATKLLNTHEAKFNSGGRN